MGTAEARNQFVGQSYMKGGVVRLPGKKETLSQFGYGSRFQRGREGWDLSMGGTYSGNRTYLNPKMLYLYTLNPQHSCRFYLGTGLGWSYYYRSLPQQGNPRKQNWITSESVIGCEFFADREVKPFIQAELTQNLIPLGTTSKAGLPGIGLTAGLRF